MKSKRGQAAMEYLMTYGWALLVIVIVIAVLLTMMFKPPNQCTFEQPGFACSTNPAITEKGDLYGKLVNGQSTTVKVFALNCTADRGPQPAPSCDATATALGQIPPQGLYELTDSTHTLTCTKIGGGEFVGGETFSGRLWIWYKFSDDGADYPCRSAVANIVTNVPQKAA